MSARHRPPAASDTLPKRAPPAAGPSPARIAFLASTAGLGAAAAHAAVATHTELGALGALALGWSALTTAGVFFPGLEMYTPVVSRGPDDAPYVALTFDDGPYPVTTRRVLDALARTHHRATFFVLGDKARRHPDVVREMHRQGHTIGVHGDVHDRLHSFRSPARVREEIVRAA